MDARTQNDRLAGGEAVALTISANATCSASSPAAWPIAVKQSNQFLGAGNDFTLDGAIPALTASGSGGPLSSFSVTTSPSPATAGQPITVTATAYDTCGQVKSDYIGPVGLTPTGTLGNSAKAPAGDSTAPSYGQFGTWTRGTATASVTAKKAETGQTITVTADSRTGTSASFTVQPATPLFPAFANQPSDAQVSSTIYSNVLTQAPVTVAVADVYGNPAPDGTSVSMTGPAGLMGTLTRTTSSGVASFGDLSLATLGSYQLTAQVGIQSTTSATFQVVVALRICDGKNTCDAPASSPNGKQSADTTISAATGTTFQGGVVLESTFSSAPDGCAGFDPIPNTQGSYVQVATSTGNLATSRPSFTITYTFPKATLKAAGLDNFGAAHFNLCLGAKRLDGGAGAWTTKSGALAVLEADGFYWGIVPDPSSSLPANNPYIAAKKKTGAGDLVIVLVKPYPWDGWGFGG